MASSTCFCFGIPQDVSPDITLLCEDGDLHVSSALISRWSPVLREVVSACKDEARFPLPGKKMHEILVFLKYIYPPGRKAVQSVGDARVLLTLAHEYSVAHLKQLAEEALCRALAAYKPDIGSCDEGDNSDSEDFHNLCIAEAVQLACRCEAPELQRCCENLMIANPCMAFAIIAEKHQLYDVLGGAIEFIGDNLKELLDDKIGSRGIGHLSAHTLQRVLSYYQQKHREDRGRSGR